MSELTQEHLDAMKKHLLEDGKINIDRCVMVLCNGEQIIGEIDESQPLECPANGYVELKDPKRVLRIQHMDKASGSIVTNFVVGDFDLVEGGRMKVKADAWVSFPMLSFRSQKNFVSLMRDVVANKMRERAAEAGLVTPSPSLIKSTR